MESVTTNSFSRQQQLAKPDIPTYWEHIARNCRWGQYTSEIERCTIERALGMVSTPTRALEVGCEGGRWSRMLADQGWEVACTDVNDDSLRQCQQRIPEAHCLLVQPNDSTFPCESGVFRLLLCIEVFPVMAGSWFPAEASRVLSDNGILVGVFLNRRSIRGAFVHYRSALGKQSGDSEEHSLYPCSYVEWKRILQQHSLEVVYEQGYCWFPFPRTSNSRLIPLCTRLESLLGLRQLPSLSPWVVFIARKIKTQNA
jgi:SAM-dependent methyltransferase